MYRSGITICFTLLLAVLVSQRSATGEELVKVLKNGITYLHLNYTEYGLDFDLVKNDVSKMTGTIGVGYDFRNITWDKGFRIAFTNSGLGFRVRWAATNLSIQAIDCIDLQKGKLHWYGGPQIYQQEWPIENLQLSGDEPYVVRKDSNFAVPERYWLSSSGAYVFVEDRVPLFVDQNMLQDDRVCFIAKLDGPYIGRDLLYHDYHLVPTDNVVTAHLEAVRGHLGLPSGLPSEKMIKDPIWTTWAKYKKSINDSIVRDFAYDILDHGFKGQIEIDEQWETCFGSREFLPDKFGNISAVIKDLQSKDLRVTLWAAPFVNPDCTDLIAEGETKGYFVKNTAGNMSTVWWESSDARQIDFTNPEAREWYTEKLQKIAEDPGVDGFKFDAGETDYVAQPAVYDNEDPEYVPNVFTQRYINTVAQFGEFIEARSAFRTQNYTFLLRMIDKDSVWGLDDGLQSLVTTLLQLNMVGYSFILPDMIGGNGYRAQPTLELLIRWTQATVFMPSMQFSYLPWDFEDDDKLNGTAIVRKMVDLHAEYTPSIIKALNLTVNEAIPTNPPIWFLDPTDEIALATNDEFLLGIDILVAPVMEEGATARSVYLPKGYWKDGNNDAIIYTGPLRFDYNAPLDTLPFFIRTMK